MSLLFVAPCVADKTSSAEEASESKWTEPATKLLISTYEECFKELKSSLSFTKKRLWERIAGKMSDHGYSFSADRVKNKWTILEKAFKEKVAGNNSTGNSKKSCALQIFLWNFTVSGRAMINTLCMYLCMLYRELTEVLSRKSSIIPECLLGTDTEMSKSQIMARAGISCATAR